MERRQNPQRLAREENLQQLLVETRHGGQRDHAALPLQRGGGRRLQLEAMLADQFQGAQHADGILLETLFRIADRPHDAGLQILNAARIVDDAARSHQIHVEGVHREITPLDIVFQRAEFIVAPYHHAVVFVAPLALLLRRLAAECAHFEFLRADANLRQTETAADHHAVAAAENGPHLFRRRIRRDVVVLRFAPQKQVANSPADQIRLVSVLNQTRDDLHGRRTHFIQ